MKKLFLMAVMFAAASMFVGCNDKKSASSDEMQDSLVMDSIEVVDSTVYGRCGDGSAMHTLELITDKGDTMLLNVNLDSVPNVKGGMAVGDRMAVILEKDEDGEDQAKTVLNLTTLLGKWSALDKSFEIQEGGVVISEHVERNPYTEWKICNGKLVLSSDTFDIYELWTDSLMLENDKGIFSYKRIK